jgi:2,4-dienoyl-CoA reductase-like NADH-dependent reductase (Old Yellow Enzyme family)
MCQYSAAADGLPNDWHLVHLGRFAVGGSGLVMTEATAVIPDGRITPADTGLWNDDQAARWQPIVRFVQSQGARIGVQLGHAGRKGSTTLPWEGIAYLPPEDGGWVTVGPSAVPFGPSPAPRKLDRDGISEVVAGFREAARRADAAGFDVIEVHAAHGYLLHQFLSPLSNRRDDEYGGSFDDRVRMVLEVTDAVRDVWPADKPLFVRVSATDWFEGGWEIDDTVALCAQLADHGVDLIDCSSGGSVADLKAPEHPGYLVGFARRVRHESGIPTGAVGIITEARQAEDIIAEGSADAVLLGRAMQRDPHWPLRAAVELGVEVERPRQYAWNWEAVLP